jgi:hypothetical protein
MYAVGIETLCEADAVIDDEGNVRVRTNALQRLGQPCKLVLVDGLHTQLESRDWSSGKRGLQLVREISAYILRADEVQLALLAALGRGKGGQVGFILNHAPLISVGRGFVQ